jgi:hypothetical protein
MISPGFPADGEARDRACRRFELLNRVHRSGEAKRGTTTANPWASRMNGEARERARGCNASLMPLLRDVPSG